MRRLVGTALAGVLAAGTGLAAPGDRLVIAGDGVNLRAGPGLGTTVRLQLRQGEAAVEVERAGEWVRVELPARAAEGWVHGSLLEPLEGGPADAEAAGGAAAPGAATGEATVQPRPPIERFRASVDYLNHRVLSEHGARPFAGAERDETGAVRVRVRDAWHALPQGEREHYRDALFERWTAAASAGVPLRLEIVDEDGEVLMDKARP